MNRNCLFSIFINRLGFGFQYQTISSDFSQVMSALKTRDAARNPSSTTTSDKQKHTLPDAAAAALNCFCVFVSPFGCNAPSCLSALFLAAAAAVLPPPPSPLSSQPPQNHLFFSNQVQHLVPETAFVLCVRTDFRRAEARLGAAAMIRPK